MKYIKFILLFLGVSFSVMGFCEKGSYSLNEGSIRILNEFADRSCEKYNLVCEGHMGGAKTRIHSIGAIFRTKRVLSIDESRLLTLRLVKDFQTLINADEPIQGYLLERPFPIERIGMMIRLYSEDSSRPPSDDIATIHFVKNKLYYTGCDLSKSIFDQREIEETLEDACKKADFDISEIEPIHTLSDDMFKGKKTCVKELYDKAVGEYFYAIFGMSDKEREMIRNHILVIALGGSMPVPLDFAREGITFYPEKDNKLRDRNNASVNTTYQTCAEDAIMHYEKKFRYFRQS